MIDTPGPVRPGDELNATSLEAYLRSKVRFDGSIAIQQFRCGYANLTYLVRVGGRELVLRRARLDARIGRSVDIERECRLLTGLHGVYPRAPRPLAICRDASVIGAPFYLMERATGIILRGAPPAGLDLDDDLTHRLCLNFIEALVELHAIDVHAADLEWLGDSKGYAPREVAAWTKRLQDARTDNLREMEEIGRWLAVHAPPSSPAVLLHNDYRYDNVVLDPADPSKVIAVLDWEMAAVGDPLIDVGMALACWAEPADPEDLRALGLTWLPGNLDRRSWLDRYATRSGRAPANPVFYYVFGLFKLGALAQEIYARYRKGYSRDARSEWFVEVVRACSQMAARAIDKDRFYALFG